MIDMLTKPLKEQMIEAIDVEFDSFDTETVDFNFSREVAIFYFAMFYHGGQWSELYSILSTSDYNPGAGEDFDDLMEECDVDKMIYDFIVQKFGRLN